MTESQSRFGPALIVALGVFAFATILAFHNITDGDLWGKLAIGASWWETGHVLKHDVFAFTPVLVEEVDHEWGAGVVFYGLIKFFGPPALMALKMALAFGALSFALATGRKQGCSANVLLFVAVPAAACILQGYVPVVRSHAFTYCLFAATLFGLEEMRGGARWPFFALPLVILLWSNLHGGFVVGLGVIWFYAAAAIILRKDIPQMAGMAVACGAVTFINPYGARFWKYLIPALLNPRARIAEWRPPPLLAWDDFWGFRLCFVLTVVVIALGWRKVTRRNFYGLVVLAVTAAMSWRSRRHGPFFGVATLAFAGPYYAAVAASLPLAWRARVNPTWLVGGLYAALAFAAALRDLPRASWQPLAPVGEDPVREADILSRAGVKGNLATPFAWGSYLAGRLYPKIKISMDGRYESAYPESTFLMNAAFFDHQGDWLQLCRSFKVDFVILDLTADPLRPEDLVAQGYVLIWQQDHLSALLCLPEHAALLEETVRNLPPYTIDPLNLKTRPQPLFAGHLTLRRGAREDVGHADVGRLGRVHDFDDLPHRRIGIGPNGQSGLRIGLHGLDQSLRQSVQRDRVGLQVKRALFWNGDNQRAFTGALFGLFGDGQRQFDGRLLLESRCDHQKNQHDDQHVNQRDDDDRRSLALSLGDEIHGLINLNQSWAGSSARSFK